MMKQQDIFKKIGSILLELNEQYEFLAQDPQQFNDLELELFLANAHFLSDHVQIIKKLNELEQTKSLPEATPKIDVVDAIPPVEQNYIKDEESFEPEALTEVTDAYEGPVVEPKAVEINHNQVEKETVENDFFKPDNEEKTFEFVLGNHSIDDGFDFEAKPVEDIFDRPLTKAEEEVLAKKKQLQKPVEDDFIANEEEEIAEELLLDEEDEIGPEPFLISTEETEEALTEEPQKQGTTTFVSSEYVEVPVEPIEESKVAEEVIADKPIFTPEAIPVKPNAAFAEKPSLNDLLAKTNGAAQEPIKNPISDLKQAINLNEKLLFIKDLFNGYNLAYSEVIDLVNRMKSFEEADSFLQKNYAVKNNWSSKQATVDQFYELLNRRFS
ncbi:hypothetical protein [Pedobacter sp. MW01-1-1]|uniref:hypothetical protein n=1 Tax=Pedobacter sp. MW01-1-1 TaxID=3383027 RepID=UPI003FEFCCB2